MLLEYNDYSNLHVSLSLHVDFYQIFFLVSLLPKFPLYFKSEGMTKRSRNSYSETQCLILNVDFFLPIYYESRRCKVLWPQIYEISPLNAVLQQ